MPTTASPYKIAAAKQVGANVILHGYSTADGSMLAHRLQKASGATLIPPSGHEHILAGQATVMKEFSAQVESMCDGPLDLVLVPSAGGALLSGTGIVCAESNTLVIGAEPENGGADLRNSRRTGLRCASINHEFTTIAEGLRSPTADFNWRFLCNDRYVHDVFGATEDHIKQATRLMMEELKMIVEPSAAVTLAVLLFNKDCLRLLAERKRWRIGVVISGGNISIDKLIDLTKDA
jgi:threonine dehydratase